MPKPALASAAAGFAAEIVHSVASAICSRRSTSPGELHVRLRPRTAKVVQQHRHAMGRRLGHAHVARNHRVVDTLAEEAAHVRGYLLSKVVAPIEHGEQDALDLEVGIEGAAYAIDRPQQQAEAFQREELALQRHQDRLGGDQCIDRQQAQRRRTVDQYVVVVLVGTGERLLADGIRGADARPARPRPQTGQATEGTTSRPGSGCGSRHRQVWRRPESRRRCSRRALSYARPDPCWRCLGGRCRSAGRICGRPPMPCPKFTAVVVLPTPPF